MTLRTFHCVAVSAALAAAGAAQAHERCNPPHDMLDARACAKAAEGAAALRRFVERTRMLWHLYYWDYAPRDTDDKSAATAARPRPKQSAAADQAG